MTRATRSHLLTGLFVAGIVAAFMAVALVIVMLTAPQANPDSLTDGGAAGSGAAPVTSR